MGISDVVRGCHVVTRVLQWNDFEQDPGVLNTHLQGLFTFTLPTQRALGEIICTYRKGGFCAAGSNGVRLDLLTSRFMQLILLMPPGLCSVVV